MEINVKLEGYLLVDFDPKAVRAGVRKSAALVRKEARKLVARRAISQPGGYPGKESGTLQRSIKVRMAHARGGKGGMWASIAPQKTEGMDNFYPAILVHGVQAKPFKKGHKKGHKKGQKPRNKDDRPRAKTGTWRIAPRKNFMEDALNSQESSVNSLLTDALYDALVPRRYDYK